MEQAENAEALKRELDWLSRVIDLQISAYFADVDQRVLPFPEPPDHSNDTVLGQTITTYRPEIPSRIMLGLCLAHAFRPELLDPFLIKDQSTGRAHSAFGGVLEPHRAGFLPTGTTVRFLCRNLEFEQAGRSFGFMSEKNPMIADGVILFDGDSSTIRYSQTMSVSDDFQHHLLSGNERPTSAHPVSLAKRLPDAVANDELVFSVELRRQLDHIAAWCKHADSLTNDWGLADRVPTGFRVLFHGPPGTGKTLAATLLGQRTQRDVYRVDLSMVVSKYIGEIEKTLGSVFDQAERKGHILFFDEADALFGKRSAVSNSNDHYANQEVSYLLQRIEQHSGLVILASTLRANIDDAFFRRFQLAIAFRRPDAQERAHLWEKVLQAGVPVAADVDVAALARDHDLSYPQIWEAVRHAALQALNDGQKEVRSRDFNLAIADLQRMFVTE
ncbi:MAG: ATP-binding protein [Pseudomonadota bacterium]